LTSSPLLIVDCDTLVAKGGVGFETTELDGEIKTSEDILQVEEQTQDINLNDYVVSTNSSTSQQMRCVVCQNVYQEIDLIVQNSTPLKRVPCVQPRPWHNYHD
jgi:hypothetical protein